MIICKMARPAGIFTVFESKGHASKGAGGVSIPCAVVSALVRSMGSLLEKREDVVVRVERFQPGAVRIRVLQVDEKGENWLHGLTDMLVQGLEDVQRDFPDQLEFSIMQSKLS